ncbi:hypothetical protein [Streptomyces diastatochromogenes]|uniref:hypothetical protein n=1 Tax=Streptomyces diastatochromogenes TaxID=42236 RepID=UPI00369C6509
MKADSAGPQGDVTYKTEALLLESALHAEGLFAKQWVDGSLGTKTREAYTAWQRSKAGGSYSESAADGYPGIQSLSRLGTRHNILAVACPEESECQMKIAKIWKAVVVGAATGTAAAATTTAVQDGRVTTAEGLTIVLAILGRSE